jgi:hypothetical protein
MAKCLYSATISVMSLECYKVLLRELFAQEKHWLAVLHFLKCPYSATIDVMSRQHSAV